MSEQKLKPKQLSLLQGLSIIAAILSILDWFALCSAVTAVVAIEIRLARQWYLRWPAATVSEFAMACFGTLGPIGGSV